LHATGKPASKVIDKHPGMFPIPQADKEARNEFCFRVDGNPGPDTTGPGNRIRGFRQVLILRINEGPDFVELKPFAGQVPHNFVLELCRCLAGIHQQFCYGVDAHPGHAGRGPQGAAFRQGTEDCDTLLSGQLVHADIMHDRSSIVKWHVGILAGKH
jgi:hypothetical protein